MTYTPLHQHKARVEQGEAPKGGVAPESEYLSALQMPDAVERFKALLTLRGDYHQDGEVHDAVSRMVPPRTAPATIAEAAQHARALKFGGETFGPQQEAYEKLVGHVVKREHREK